MKKIFLGLSLMALVSNSYAVDHKLHIQGDSLNVVDRSSYAAMDAGAYDLGIEATATFQDNFELRFTSSAIQSDLSQIIYAGGPDAAKSKPGIKHDNGVDMLNLVGAADAATFCSLNDAKIKANASAAACAAHGVDADAAVITIPLDVAFLIQGSLQLDVAAMTEQGAGAAQPLQEVKLGADSLTASMTILNGAKDLKSSAGGNIYSPGLVAEATAAGIVGSAEVGTDKAIPLSFKLPFKGASFAAQRSSLVKIVGLVKSL